MINDKLSESTREARVTAPTGTYIGSFDGTVESYLGVRYAAPVEKFKPPVDVLTTSCDVIDAAKFGPAGLQPYDDAILPSQGEISSDCLYLNIWTKDTAATGKPVMLFIHGGGFVSSGGSDAPSNGRNFTADLPCGDDVVMITISYRLGLPGAIDMSLLDGFSGEYACCNNLWILDIIQSLKWVNENISAFGGDPSNVTIFGQSAGGMACVYLCAIESARQYFQKAIIHSGAPFYGLRDLAKHKENSQRVFDILGVSSVAELVSLSDDELMKDIPNYTYVGADLQPRYIDGLVIPVTWLDEFKKGAAKDITIMLGVTSGEHDFAAYDRTNADFNVRSAADIFADMEDRFAALGNPRYALSPVGNEAITEAFMSLAPNSSERAAALSNRFGHDIGYRYIAEHQSKFNNVYMYRFCWLPDIHAVADGVARHAAFSAFGRSPHCADLPVLFDTCETSLPFLAKWWAGQVKSSIKDAYDMLNVPEKLTKQMQAAWYAFAKTGNPNNDLIPEWNVYTGEKKNTMMINEKWVQSDDPLKDDFSILGAISPADEKQTGVDQH